MGGCANLSYAEAHATRRLVPLQPAFQRHTGNVNPTMCNLYSLTKSQAAIIAIVRAMRDKTGNLPPLPGIFPDYFAPVVRNAPDGVRELAMCRWGMPSSQLAQIQAAKNRAQRLEARGKPAGDFKELLRMEPDIGTTNIRNTRSMH